MLNRGEHIKTLLTYVINFFVGVVGSMLLISQLTSGKSVSGTGLSFKLDGTGLIIWVVVLVAYFFLSKKFWGKTVGGKIVDSIMSKK